MQITMEFIKQELEGFYPSSSRITPKILGEMFGMLQGLDWTEHDFSTTLKQYRNDPIRMEKGTLNFPPDVRQLIALWKKSQAAPFTSVTRTKPPTWFKGAGEAMRKDGRTGLAVYMLSQAEQHPEYKLDRDHWYQEAEYCLNREPPKTKGNLAINGTLTERN